MGQKLMADRLHKERMKRLLLNYLHQKPATTKMENYHLEKLYQRNTFIGTAKMYRKYYKNYQQLI